MATKSPILDLAFHNTDLNRNIFLIFGIAGLPWYTLTRLVLRDRAHRQMLLQFAYMVCFLAATIAFSSWLLREYIWFQYTIQALAFLVFGIFTIVTSYVAKESLSAWRGERRSRQLAKHSLTQFDGYRTTIAHAFAAITTARGRDIFIAGVAATVAAGQFRTLLENPDNRWPDGRRPNFGDSASTRLAQLDEAWLRLDR